MKVPEGCNVLGLFQLFCQYLAHNDPLPSQPELLNAPDLKCETTMSSEIMVGADKEMVNGVNDGRFLTIVPNTLKVII